MGTAYFSPYFKARLMIMPHILTTVSVALALKRGIFVLISHIKGFPTIISLYQSRQCTPSRLLIHSTQQGLDGIFSTGPIHFIDPNDHKKRYGLHPPLEWSHDEPFQKKNANHISLLFSFRKSILPYSCRLSSNSFPFPSRISGRFHDQFCLIKGGNAKDISVYAFQMLPASSHEATSRLRSRSYTSHLLSWNPHFAALPAVDLLWFMKSRHNPM